MTDEYIAALVRYAEKRGLISDSERIWAVNTLLEVMKEDSFSPLLQSGKEMPLSEILDKLTDTALSRGLLPRDSIEYRDLFDTALMGRITPRPAQVIERFNALYSENPISATDWFYTFCRDTNYIRRDRMEKDLKWVSETEYGTIDITINLAKPEKDPRDIAAADSINVSEYPACMLCAENEGYAGHTGYPARGNHRVIPIELGGEKWFFQYSPYVYYNEHCIALSANHSPMNIDRDAFIKLLDFLEHFPHYFIGSNAGLPIVGGSILSHEHFQGGRYTFAMENAPIEKRITFPGYQDIEAGIVKWPMSTIRLRSRDRERILNLACAILDKWRDYSDESALIFAETKSKPHNAITPVARFKDGAFELDLILRNNITTEKHPFGVFHPHTEMHHIKKENIGLIEAMGLAVLPARLDTELKAVADSLLSGADLRSSELTAHHADWAEGIAGKYSLSAGNIDGILRGEVGLVFLKILEQCGVFKRNAAGMAAFMRFIETI